MLAKQVSDRVRSRTHTFATFYRLPRSLCSPTSSSGTVSLIGTHRSGLSSRGSEGTLSGLLVGAYSWHFRWGGIGERAVLGTSSLMQGRKVKGNKVAQHWMWGGEIYGVWELEWSEPGCAGNQFPGDPCRVSMFGVVGERVTDPPDASPHEPTCG